MDLAPDGSELFARIWRPSGYADTTQPIDGGEDYADVAGRLRVPVGYTDTGEPIYDDQP